MIADSFHAVAKALHGADVRFIVVGGLAVAAHGYGRLTLDIDVVIRLDSETVLRAFTALESIDYHPAVPISAEQFGNAEIRERLRIEKQMVVLKFWSDRHRDRCRWTFS